MQIGVHGLVFTGTFDEAGLQTAIAGTQAAGFDLLEGEQPIIPVMIPDARDAVAMADALRRRGVYVTAFSYPVVPIGRSRLRVQISAAHTEEELRRAAEQFVAAREELR